MPFFTCCAPAVRGATCRTTAFRRSTVYNVFRKFQGGTWEGIWAELHVALRERMGRGGKPVGGRSRQPISETGGKGGGQDDQVGYDAGKKVKGRKIHALVDTEGLPIYMRSSGTFATVVSARI